MNEGLVRLKVLDTKRKQQEELLAVAAKKVMILIRRHLMKYVLSLLIDGMHSITSKPLTKHLSQHLTLCASLLQQKWSLPLSQKNKEQIKTATENLKQAGEKYFASVPFPEVERMVAKTMLQTYASYIPEEQRINIFEIINSRFKGNIDSFVDACFEYSILVIPRTLKSLSKNQELYIR